MGTAEETGSKMQITIERITPAIAAAYLDASNTSNRPMRPQHVRALASDMQAGMWMLTHEPIAFASDGVLLDGQHRLAAIVQSNKSVEVAVARDCKRETFVVVGCGSQRKASDVLSLAGEQNAVKLSAMVVSAIIGPQTRVVTRQEVAAYVCGPMGDVARSLASNTGGATSGVTGALLRAITAGVISADGAREFLRIHGTGDWHGSDDPICRLKSIVNGRMPRQDAYMYAVRAIIAYVNGDRVKLLRKASADFETL
jgi:hypothetical protein